MKEEKNVDEIEYQIGQVAKIATRQKNVEESSNHALLHEESNIKRSNKYSQEDEMKTKRSKQKKSVKNLKISCKIGFFRNMQKFKFSIAQYSKYWICNAVIETKKQSFTPICKAKVRYHPESIIPRKAKRGKNGLVFKR